MLPVSGSSIVFHLRIARIRAALVVGKDADRDIFGTN
jgi:hypothetical protein